MNILSVIKIILIPGSLLLVCYIIYKVRETEREEEKYFQEHKTLGQARFVEYRTKKIGPNDDPYFTNVFMMQLLDLVDDDNLYELTDAGNLLLPNIVELEDAELEELNEKGLLLKPGDIINVEYARLKNGKYDIRVFEH